ncbi:MAG: galactose-1-phosphate uridylyltransferase [Tissierellia bacterium]|nr:galactose-1-phosphate uridylyltransferase [Tissierellia bacterium]
MAELRYNPLLGDWVMVSADRSKRPDMPKDFCPFDPGSGKVPEDYDVLKYDNDFPILSQNPPKPDDVGSEFYKTKESYGKCDVILYSPDHNAHLYEQSIEHIEKLVRLWKERFIELKKDQKIKYIFPFENRGKEVGTTMPHPHGQIYAYSEMPLRLKIELENAKAYYEKTGDNIFSKMISEEKEFKERMIYEDENFAIFVPFFCEYPYGVYIVAKNDIASFEDFKEAEIHSFAKILKRLTLSFDRLFDREFPYMMCIYQRPVNSDEYRDCDKFYRFNVKFFPPLRGKNSIKWNASSETGAWVHGNPRRVEETAKELRESFERSKDAWQE